MYVTLTKLVAAFGIMIPITKKHNTTC